MNEATAELKALEAAEKRYDAVLEETGDEALAEQEQQKDLRRVHAGIPPVPHQSRLTDYPRRPAAGTAASRGAAFALSDTINGSLNASAA
jgi:hypothetical protein